MKQQNSVPFTAWLLFIILSIIWGSSFILMKLGMFNEQGEPVLSAYQVAAIRLLGAGLALVPFLPKAFKALKAKGVLGYTVLSGLLGSFFPAFLFCMAESKISSGFAGFINSMTPFFTLLIARFFYGERFPASKTVGILFGLAGCVLLFLDAHNGIGNNAYFGLLALLATVFYALNVNMVRKRLMDVHALHVAAVALSSLVVPAFIILASTGYFSLPHSQPPILKADLAALTLGVAGTALASVLFYRLVKLSGVIFSSMVTYGIPFVALGWSLVFGERLSWLQVIALLVILVGVYIANRNKN